MRNVFVVMISVLITLVLIGIVIYFMTLKEIDFTKTKGKVIDESGNPIENARVVYSYKCLYSGLNYENYNFFGIGRELTNLNGEFVIEEKNFGSKSGFTVGKCFKNILAYKEGYCGQNSCNGAANIINTERYNIQSSIQSDKDGFYYYNTSTEKMILPNAYALPINGSFYHAFYFSDYTTVLSSNEEEIVFTLNKTSYYQFSRIFR